MKYWYSIIAFFVILLVAGSCAGPDHNSRGVNLMQEGKLSEAYAEFEKAYDNNPESPYSLNNMGYVYEMKYGDYSKAEELYEKALEKCSPAHITRSAVDEGLVGKPLEEAIKKNLKRVRLKMKRTGFGDTKA